MRVDERIDEAERSYVRAVFDGDAEALVTAERGLDAVEADLALARGRIAHARFLQERTEDPHELALFQRATELYEKLGDRRGEAESLFWVGCFHQVVRHDDAAAVPVLERSAHLATEVGDPRTLSYALRHLGIAAHAAGRLSEASERLQESTRLRREVGFLPGVAANLVGLAWIAVADDRREDARAFVAEAGDLAERTGAAAILAQVDEVRGAV